MATPYEDLRTFNPDVETAHITDVARADVPQAANDLRQLHNGFYESGHPRQSARFAILRALVEAGVMHIGADDRMIIGTLTEDTILLPVSEIPNAQ